MDPGELSVTTVWDLRDARVVCRMRGFDGASDAPGSARFGEGSGGYSSR